MNQKQDYFRYSLLLVILINIPFSASYSQEKTEPKIDTTFIEAFPESTFLRLYLSRKFTGFNIDAGPINQVLRYEPNTTRNLGVGITYKWATLNLAYGFGFMNPDEGKGETRYLDLQSHQYMGKWNVDLYGQFYWGYFVENTPDIYEEPYLRPDLSVIEIGTSVQYVFNHEKFSFKAAFLNSEYQKKSVGTLFTGLDVFYGRVNADSTLIPYFYREQDNPDYEELNFIKTGPLIGYAYSLVVKERFYATAALGIHFTSGFYTLTSAQEVEESIFFSTDVSLRTALGYRINDWNIGAFFIYHSVQATDNYRNVLSTGNIRFIVTYRLNWLKKLF